MVRQLAAVASIAITVAVAAVAGQSWVLPCPFLPFLAACPRFAGPSSSDATATTSSCLDRSSADPDPCSYYPSTS